MSEQFRIQIVTTFHNGKVLAALKTDRPMAAHDLINALQKVIEGIREKIKKSGKQETNGEPA